MKYPKHTTMEFKMEKVTYMLVLMIAGIFVEAKINISIDQDNLEVSNNQPLNLLLADRNNHNYNPKFVRSQRDEKHFSAKRNLHEPCSADDQCLPTFSGCYGEVCHCNQNYIEHNNTCYGLPNAPCNLPKDCALISNSCLDGTCTRAEDLRDGKWYPTKPEASYITGQYSHDLPSGTDHLIGTRLDSLQWATGNLSWESHFTLDKVYMHQRISGQGVIFDCRVEATGGKFMFGTREIPGDGNCTGQHNGQKFLSEKFSFLVDLGK